MKNHFGTFAPKHDINYLFNINKSDAILGGNPVRQQLCFIDSLFANKLSNMGAPDAMPCYLVMGVFAPAVDYLTIKKVREGVQGWTHDAATIDSYMTTFGYTTADPVWVLVPPADGTTNADAGAGTGGASGSGGANGSGGAGGGGTSGSGGAGTGGTSGSAGARTGGNNSSGGAGSGGSNASGGAGSGGAAAPGGTASSGGSGANGGTSAGLASGGANATGGTNSGTSTTASSVGGSAGTGTTAQPKVHLAAAMSPAPTADPRAGARP